MTPEMTLVEAMRAVADDLEQDRACYLWDYAESCYCGLVVAKILGYPDNTSQSFRAIVYSAACGNVGLWGDSRVRRMFCSSTGLPLTEVAQTLVSAGLEPHQFHEIEYCSNEAVLWSMGRDETSVQPYRHAEFVARYLRAYAAHLEFAGKGTLVAM